MPNARLRHLLDFVHSLHGATRVFYLSRASFVNISDLMRCACYIHGRRILFRSVGRVLGQVLHESEGGEEHGQVVC